MNEGAEEFAEDLRKWIEMTCKGTISIGVSYWNDNDKSSKKWHRRANKYLKLAKSHGRNMIWTDLSKQDKMKRKKTSKARKFRKQTKTTTKAPMIVSASTNDEG